MWKPNKINGFIYETNRGGEKLIRLLIIADDLTGALDTGVQFAASGAATRVITNINYDYSEAEEVKVLVMDAETRHLDSREAYQVVYNITKKAIQYGIPFIYKKTDSALRGNIGSELTAVLHAAEGESLSFFPAFPKMKRTTIDGIHYIDGVPVEESVFGKDPYEPVTCSYIPDLIKEQSMVKVTLAEEVESPVKREDVPEIIVWNAQTDDQLEKLGQRLYKENKLHVMAGCAGFAAVLPKLLGLEARPPEIPNFTQRFLVICGSVNPITLSQLEFAEANGFFRINLSAEEKLGEEYWKCEEGLKRLDSLRELIEAKSCSILDSNDLPGTSLTKEYADKYNISTEEVRVSIAKNLGYILKELLSRGLKGTMMITGGDTLIGCMEQMGVYEMEPICELTPGIVLSRFNIRNTECLVLSKSGGFGDEQLLTNLAKQIFKEDIEK
ncbi:four-carbon acid sugar kinase family protein [Clostridium sp. YIM B02500]|uniref:four-carbon acid sugar kinase family protein n=1 Tax=Clostridium sp. YIM B02500 TaxID=2910681 RepID=UPI001EED1D17